MEHQDYWKSGLCRGWRCRKSTASRESRKPLIKWEGHLLEAIWPFFKARAKHLGAALPAASFEGNKCTPHPLINGSKEDGKLFFKI